jgi:hypothetical protein
MLLAEYMRTHHPSPVKAFREPHVAPEVPTVKVSVHVISRGKMIVLASLIASALVPSEYSTYVSALGGIYWLLKL